MDIAVVTGASSGLGLAISRRLLDLGFRVYGLGGNYSDATVANVDFRPVACDLGDPGHVEARIKEILEKEGAVTVLVNNAKYYPPEDFAQGAPAEFARSLNVNLLCPLVLVRWCLSGLQRVRGCVINISSATPETARGGPAGACAAGGLRWMQESLFQQLRDDGIAVSTIFPEPNRWRPEDAPPPHGDRPQSAIDPQAVAEAVVGIIQNGRSNVITEVVIRPERIAERKIPAVRELPYPKPKPIPYTVPREQIEAEERVDREEEERELGIGQGSKKKKRRPRESASDDKATPDQSSTDPSSADQPSRKRRRRGRGGRGRGRAENQRQENRPQEDRHPERREPTEHEEHSPRPSPKDQPAADQTTEPKQPSAERPRRRRGRKPRPVGSGGDVTKHSHEPRPGPVEALKPLSSPGAKEHVAPAPAPKPAPAEAVKEKKAAPAQKPVVAEAEAPANAKPTPAKKAARKATKKTAAKKATAKKVARKATKKAATKKVAAKKATRKRVAKKAAKPAAEE